MKRAATFRALERRKRVTPGGSPELATPVAGARAGPAPVTAPAPAAPELEFPDYLERNLAAWERWAAASRDTAARGWQEEALRWGVWRVAEEELHVLDGLRPDADVLELGCGTGGTSAWLARRGMKPVGVDIVRLQLEQAAELEREHGLRFPLLRANAERLPFEDESFDAVISEYGASVWCHPHKWVPEAFRLLRPRGLLAFFVSSSLLVTCTPDTGGWAEERLVRDYFARFQIAFAGEDGAVEFHLTHEHWIELLCATGFVLERLVEPRPSDSATALHGLAHYEWARRWPTEEVWVARKPASGRG